MLVICLVIVIWFVWFGLLVAGCAFLWMICGNLVCCVLVGVLITSDFWLVRFAAAVCLVSLVRSVCLAWGLVVLLSC